jgi:hypothetical protein
MEAAATTAALRKGRKEGRERKVSCSRRAVSGKISRWWRRRQRQQMMSASKREKRLETDAQSLQRRRLGSNFLSFAIRKH